MANYSKGVIYTIRYRNDDSLIYVGSTIQPLYKRWHQHKNTCFDDKNKKYDCNIYQKIRETNDIDNWYIELYESFPCANKEELNKREGEVIRKIANLNMRIPGRSDKEYYQDNKDKFKEYREQNKDKIKDKWKEYYDNNKDKINEKRKEYREQNKDKLNEKFKCECGGCYILRHKAKHLKTKKHQNYLSVINT